MCVSGSKLFIFGGTGNKVFGDCYVFDLGTFLYLSFLRLTRYGLFFVVTKKSFVHCVVLVEERNAWEVVTASGQQQVTSRFGHSCVSSPGSRELVFFGGRGIGSKHYNDLLLFNTGTLFSLLSQCVCVCVCVSLLQLLHATNGWCSGEQRREHGDVLRPIVRFQRRGLDTQ